MKHFALYADRADERRSAPGFITDDSQGLEVEPEWEPLGVAG
jgi:hypothetical protein